MDFEREYTEFLNREGVTGQGFVPVPLVARDAAQAARQSEELAPLAGTVSFVVEDRWHSQGDSLRARVLAHCGRFRQVYARCCAVRRIDKPAAAAFLAAAHSYGDASCRFRYGLFLGEELVAVAEFSSARNWVKDARTIRSYEWVRYASLPGTRVVGGMGKLLDAFAEEVRPDDVMTYADLEWSDGAAYRALGFEPDGSRSPVLFAVDPFTWRRVPVRGDAASGEVLYYQNFGSLKFRKKYNW